MRLGREKTTTSEAGDTFRIHLKYMGSVLTMEQGKLVFATLAHAARICTPFGSREVDGHPALHSLSPSAALKYAIGDHINSALVHQQIVRGVRAWPPLNAATAERQLMRRVTLGAAFRPTDNAHDRPRSNHAATLMNNCFRNAFDTTRETCAMDAHANVSMQPPYSLLRCL
jgi:hypothetical protein